ncbi:DUF2092 domain-containing protein [Sphingomonas sp. KR3-1]|uniref:DUF2092 domain-containing protein n=1 Tax=Sphingomonas sp. KR3-1 TaxID=3156611 RepID=UPI0032B3C182
MDGRNRWKLGMAAIALLAAPAFAQDAAQPAPTTAAGTIDPLAVAALQAMGSYMKSLKSFEIHSKATIETNMEDTDLKVTLGLDNIYRVQRPNAFFIELRSDRQFRQFYYDGKTFTVSVPRQGFYSVVDAPPTIRAVVDGLYDEYGVSLPLSDIFTWADAGAPTEGLQSAVRVGYARIGGVDTDQFAFRGEDLDFQLWIARGPKPLPMKIAITDRSDPVHPSYSAELTWNTAVKFTPASFAFKPPSGASKIQMAKLDSVEKP